MAYRDHSKEWPIALTKLFSRAYYNQESDVVLFIGSGLSCRTKNQNGKSAPTWEELLLTLTQLGVERHYIKKERQTELELLLESKNPEDYLIAANYISKKFGRDELDECIAEIFNFYKTSDNTYEILCMLPVAGFVSTNFDTYLIDAYSAKHRISLKSYAAQNPRALKVIRNNEINGNSNPWLIQLHHGVGRRAEDALFVLSYDDYQTAYSDGRIETLLYNIFTRYTVLFLGFGFRDVFIMNILRDIIKKMGTASPMHYTLGHASEFNSIKTRFLKEKYNIFTVIYDDEEREEKFSAFPDRLKELHVEAINNTRPTSRLLIDYKYNFNKKTYTLLQTFTYTASNGEQNDILLWPSIIWPLMHSNNINDKNKAILLNAIAEYFAGSVLQPSETDLFSKAKIVKLGEVFEEQKSHLHHFGADYSFHFQFITIEINTTQYDLLNRKLQNKGIKLELIEADNIENKLPPPTLEYNKNVVEQFNKHRDLKNIY